MAKQKQDIASENIRLNTELIKSNQDIRTLEEKLKEWLLISLIRLLHTYEEYLFWFSEGFQFVQILW